MSTLRFKCDQIGRITLCVVMDDKQTWVSNVVDNRIIQNVRLLPLFCWWHPHSTLSSCEFSSEDFTKVHSLVFLTVRSGISVRCREASIYSKIHPLSICCGCRWKNIISIWVRYQMRNQTGTQYFNYELFLDHQSGV